MILIILGCPQQNVGGGKGGIITSPRFPLKYESRTYCEWEIKASQPQNRILIQLETFKIEGKMARDDGKTQSFDCSRGIDYYQNYFEIITISVQI